MNQQQYALVQRSGSAYAIAYYSGEIKNINVGIAELVAAGPEIAELLSSGPSMEAVTVIGRSLDSYFRTGQDAVAALQALIKEIRTGFILEGLNPGTQADLDSLGIQEDLEAIRASL